MGRTSGAKCGGLKNYALVLGGTQCRTGGEQRAILSICKLSSAPQKRMQLRQQRTGHLVVRSLCCISCWGREALLGADETS